MDPVMRGSGENGQGSRLTLLIADDDPVVRSMLSMAFEQRFEIVGSVDDAVLDPEVLARLRQDFDPEMRKRLIETFEQALCETLVAIGSALNEGGEAELERILHRLKGSAATIGAGKLSQACEEFRRLLGGDQTMVNEQATRLEAIAELSVVQLRDRLLDRPTSSRWAA
jgi:HPt (histidine-containing phosphotransfer) domain-containing protein